MPKQRDPRAGFTIIELMMVIGIIAILIGILLPSLARVRGSAVRTVGLSNIRQLHLAVQMYVNDSSGIYPSTQDGRSYPTTGLPGGPLVGFPYWQIHETWTGVIIDQLPYAENVEILISPNSLRLEDDFAPWPSSYKYATAFAGQPRLWSGRDLIDPLALRVAAREHQVVFPSAKTLLWDAEMAWLFERTTNSLGDALDLTTMAMADGSASLRAPADAELPTPNAIGHAFSDRRLYNTTDGVRGRDYTR